MTTRCPYGHISYASWRLKAFHRLAIEVSATLPARRSFMTSSSCHYPKPNPNQKKRYGNPRRRRMQELSKLESLRAEISGLAKELKSKPLAAQSSSPSTPTEGKESILDLPIQPEDVRHAHAPPSQFLPKSPIVTRLEQRRTRLKPRAGKQDIDRLKYNPWAQILASPVRMCVATGARIPDKLLGDWGLVQHPETKQPWILPVDLVKEELQRVSAKVIPAPSSETRNGIPEEDPVLPPPPPRPRSRFRSFHMMSSAEMLDAISKMKGTQPGRLIPSNWKVPKGRLQRKSTYVFRRDMPDYYLARMRERVMAWLKKAKELRPVGEKSGDWTVLDMGMEAIGEEGLKESLRKLGDLEHVAWGAVFISRRAGMEDTGNSPPGEESAAEEDNPNGPSTSEVVSADESMSPEAPIAPEAHSESTKAFLKLPNYIALPAICSIVPVFDLTTLLTEEQLKDLRHHADIFRHPAIFYRPGERAPASMISWLWNLKIYMMKYDRP
ncbi:hypothetical protein ACJ73_06769 [Blastomyces percursus]|uniref:Uncharacterized protein n=1 Tax=Blastomyces percursus TaxID=1658174 RepID=A0A1J9PZY6_9EURO|nr:hypothetical protein ACJ73_06769 [Blastomyces percursus]